MFISPAFAQDTAAVAGDPTVFNLGLILVLFILFYFLMIRPQNKRMKEQRAMLDSLKKGDSVLTAGGFMGVITKIVDEREVEIEIAKGVTVKAMRYSIQEKLNKDVKVAVEAATKPAKKAAKPAAQKAPAKKTAAKKAPAKTAAPKKAAAKKKTTTAKKKTAK